jgi:hypothetical protein
MRHKRRDEIIDRAILSVLLCIAVFGFFCYFWTVGGTKP